MGNVKKMPDAPPVKLVEARCQDKGCGMLLARLWLEGGSRVEIKCRRGKCGRISIFTADGKVYLVPDGQGGYYSPAPAKID